MLASVYRISWTLLITFRDTLLADARPLKPTSFFKTGSYGIFRSKLIECVHDLMAPMHAQLLSVRVRTGRNICAADPHCCSLAFLNARRGITFSRLRTLELPPIHFQKASNAGTFHFETIAHVGNLGGWRCLARLPPLDFVRFAGPLPHSENASRCFYLPLVGARKGQKRGKLFHLQTIMAARSRF